MFDQGPAIPVTKFDAARRQLRTAITLWFSEGDPISVHTLACAAYEIIHVVTKKEGRESYLIFDAPIADEKRRREMNIYLKNHANFFKHANKDHDATIKFEPSLSDLFILFSILGVELHGDRKNDEELAFMYWFYFHRTDLLTEYGRINLIDKIPVHLVDNFRLVPKKDFLQVLKEFRRKIGM